MSKIREEISLKLDKALRQADMGRWVGGRGSLGMIKILLQVNGPGAIFDKNRAGRSLVVSLYEGNPALIKHENLWLLFLTREFIF